MLILFCSDFFLQRSNQKYSLQNKLLIFWNGIMKGLCHVCHSSGVEVTLNESGVATCGCENTNDNKETK